LDTFIHITLKAHLFSCLICTILKTFYMQLVQSRFLLIMKVYQDQEEVSFSCSYIWAQSKQFLLLEDGNITHGLNLWFIIMNLLLLIILVILNWNISHISWVQNSQFSIMYTVNTNLNNLPICGVIPLKWFKTQH
jgi:hypothetical protein